MEGHTDITCIPSKWDGAICNPGRVLGKGSIQNLPQAPFGGFSGWTGFVPLLEIVMVGISSFPLFLLTSLHIRP